MFGKKKKARSAKQIDSLISFGDLLRTTSNFAGSLRVDGCVKGVGGVGDEPSTLVISESPCRGQKSRCLRGDRRHRRRPSAMPLGYLELLPNAKITSDVSYRTAQMQVGAVIEDVCHIRPDRPMSWNSSACRAQDQHPSLRKAADTKAASGKAAEAK